MTGSHLKTTAWMEVNSGRRIFLPITEDMLDINDVAHSLSHQCRFGGHVNDYYSVAEHSCHVADWLWQETASAQLSFTGLLHDASETYLVDVPKPIKRHLTNYALLEEEIERVIAAKWKLLYPFPELVHEADCRILNDERAALFEDSGLDWELPFTEPLGVKIQAWSPYAAKVEFLKRIIKYG